MMISTVFAFLAQALLSQKVPMVELAFSIRALPDASADGGAWIEFDFHNRGASDLYLLLGQMGAGQLNHVRLTFTPTGGQERNLTAQSAGGPALGRQEPAIVPLLSQSNYVVRVPAQRYAIPRQAGRLKAYLSVGPNEAMRNLNCYGLRIFWSGHIASNAVDWPAKPNPPK
jgi:hypothetical protein